MEEKNLLSQGKTKVTSPNQHSSAVESFFASAIAKVRADAEEAIAKQKTHSETESAEAIARVKAQAEKKARAYTDTIARIKAEAAEAIAQVKADAEEKARAYTDTIARIKAEAEEKAGVDIGTAGKVRPSTTIEQLFSDAVAKQKAKSQAEAAETIARVKAEAEKAIAEQKAQSESEAAEAIARVKADAEEKIRAYTDTINRLKAKASEKARAYSDTATKGEPSDAVDVLFSDAVARQKAKSEAEVEEKAKAYTNTVGKVKAEAAEAIAKVTTEAEDAIVKIKAKAAEAIARVKTEAEEQTGQSSNTTAEVKAGVKLTITDENKEHAVSETIRRMVQSPSVLPGKTCRKISALCTEDLMQKEFVWGSPDDSVQQSFAKMQQHGAGYMVVGRDGQLEGIVSRSDLAGAISPYLRPIFAKWRRPMDDATLQIRIKWIMSRPVHIISPQMPLGAIIINMCRSGVRALPVANQQGKVLGLVTEADIFRAILKPKDGTAPPAPDRGCQGQFASPQSPKRTVTQPVKPNQPSTVTA